MYNDPNQPQQPPYGQPQPPYEQPPYGQSQPPYGQPPTQYAPQYGSPPQYGVPPQYGGPQPPKKSLKWLWITLGIVGGLILLSCVGCSLLGANLFNSNSIFKQSFDTGFQSSTLAQRYYSAIKSQDYTLAYSYLDTTSASIQGQPQATQDAFTQIAQAADTAKGTVSSYQYAGISTDPNDLNTSTVTMNVTRGGQTYAVHLQMKQIGSTWKITSADGI